MHYRITYTRVTGESNKIGVPHYLDAGRYYRNALYAKATNVCVQGPCYCTLLEKCLVCQTTPG